MRHLRSDQILRAFREGLKLDYEWMVMDGKAVVVLTPAEAE